MSDPKLKIKSKSPLARAMIAVSERAFVGAHGQAELEQSDISPDEHQDALGIGGPGFYHEEGVTHA